MSLWRVEEAAEYLGIRPKTLYEWVRTGRVPYRKLGFNVRFDPAELSDWVESQAAGAGVPENDSGDAVPPAPAPGRAGDSADLSLLVDTARQAARQLRRVETDLGTHLSFPQRQELRDLAVRLEETTGKVSGE